MQFFFTFSYKFFILYITSITYNYHEKKKIHLKYIWGKRLRNGAKYGYVLQQLLLFPTLFSHFKKTIDIKTL